MRQNFQRQWTRSALLWAIVAVSWLLPGLVMSADRQAGERQPKPGTAGQTVKLPTFPQKFDVQGPESDSYGFAVTQPGSIAVEVQAQGAPVVVTLQSPGGQPIIQRGTGLLKIFSTATPQDVQRSFLWQVQIKAWCEEDCLTAGKRPRSIGSVMVQHPPVDQAAVQKAVQAMVAQQKQPSPQEIQSAGTQAAAQMDQTFQQRRAHFEQLQQQRRAALYAKIQPQVDQLRARTGITSPVRSRGLDESPEQDQGTTEGEIGTRAMPQMRGKAGPGGQPAAQMPTFPQQFTVQGPESDSFGFAVTQPGPIAVEVTSQGPAVVVTLQHLTSAPLSQSGSGQVRLNYDVTPQDIEKSALWFVRVRLAQTGPPVSGTVNVQHPPADPAIVQAQTAAVAEQERASGERAAAQVEAQSRAEFQAFKAGIEQQHQQRLTAERAQNQALLNRLQAKPGGMIRSRGLNPAITKINKSEGQPDTQVIIEGTNFGPGGEVVFQLGPNIVGTGIVEAWADTVVVAKIHPATSGLLPYQGTVAIKVGASLSNAVPFKFIPVEEPREIRFAQGQDVSLADPSILTGSKIEHPNNSFGGLNGSQGNDIFFPSKQLSNGWIVKDIKLKIDPCSYPDCRGAFVADSRVGTPLPFFNVRWGHGPFVGARYWFTLYIVGPRGVPDGIAVTGPLNPYVPPGTPPPATTASSTPPAQRTPPSQPPYTPPASSQPIEMTVVPVNPALLGSSYLAPGAGSSTPNQPPAGQSGTKMAVDSKNTMNPTLQQAPPNSGASMPPQGSSSTGSGTTAPPQQPGATTPVITSLSVTQGQPGDPVMINGNNFGSGAGEIHFVIANGKDVKSPVMIWSDGQIFTSVPDGSEASGLLGFNGTVYVKRTADAKMSNLVGFRFEPALRHRDIGCSPVTPDRRIQGEHQYTFLVPCVEQNGAGDLLGAKGNDEFYLSTKLSNGWVVSLVDVRQTYRYGTSGAYTWADRTGSDSPYVNVRWWRNTFSSVAYTFTITIIGPRGVPDGIVCKQAPCSDY